MVRFGQSLIKNQHAPQESFLELIDLFNRICQPRIRPTKVDHNELHHVPSHVPKHYFLRGSNRDWHSMLLNPWLTLLQWQKWTKSPDSLLNTQECNLEKREGDRLKRGVVLHRFRHWKHRFQTLPPFVFVYRVPCAADQTRQNRDKNDPDGFCNALKHLLQDHADLYTARLVTTWELLRHPRRLLPENVLIPIEPLFATLDFQEHDFASDA